jgi:hypothetical protein
MHFLLLAVILQSNPQILLQSAPSTVPSPAKLRAAGPVPQIDKSHLNTTPDLDPTTEETHAQMERDIGGHGEAIAGLKVQVETLEKLRADPDRKDIDDLKNSRDHIVWSWGILSTVIITLAGTFWALYGKFKAIVWEDSVKPRLKRYLATLIETPPTTP